MALQRRRAVAFIAVAIFAVPLFSFMASQSGYFDRLQTIRTYEEADEESAISRLHFWRVAIDMAEANPIGVGLFNYEQAYDRYDFLDGLYGHKRSVHSSHFQVLAETGLVGTVAYLFAFVLAYRSAFRTRSRGQRTDIEPADARLFFTSSNALIASISGFVVGGAFVAMALNDLLWLSFGLIAALDRISASVCLAADHATAGAGPNRLSGDYRWRRTVDLPA
jgi:O-antigen ligase